MLTSFTLLGGHVSVVFRAWQSTQEPWEGQGRGRRGEQLALVYLFSKP